MSVISRGTKNAFRNVIRSFSITLILAISIGLTLIMLLSMRAVQARIDSVKGSIGNTITITPAGARGFAGGGSPLTNANVVTIQNTPHITGVKPSLNDRLQGTTDTNLVSSIDPGTLGNRFNRRQGQVNPGGPDQATGGTITIPIQVTGTTDTTSTQVAQANQIKIISGASFDGGKDAAVALVGSALATKNNLKIGSTFTAYGTSVTVVGIYDAGNQFANAGIIMPLPTVQRLSGLDGVTSVIATVDSITNVAPTVTTLQSSLGSAADVVSAQDNSNQALAPLENIKTISLYSLVGSLVAGSVIIFLTMLMIVRERRREIGVLKAIGASNIKIMLQFVVEALTLTLSGAVVGIAGGVILSNPVLKILVASNSSTPADGGPGRGGFGGGAVRVFGGGVSRIGNTITNLHAVVGYDVLLYGLAAAILIAVVGSAIPSWLIAKVRPAEVMRAE